MSDCVGPGVSFALSKMLYASQDAILTWILHNIS